MGTITGWIFKHRFCLKGAAYINFALSWLFSSRLTSPKKSNQNYQGETLMAGFFRKCLNTWTPHYSGRILILAPAPHSSLLPQLMFNCFSNTSYTCGRCHDIDSWHNLTDQRSRSSSLDQCYWGRQSVNVLKMSQYLQFFWKVDCGRHQNWSWFESVRSPAPNCICMYHTWHVMTDPKLLTSLSFAHSWYYFWHIVAEMIWNYVNSAVTVHDTYH